MSKLLKFYHHLLKDLNLEIDDDSKVFNPSLDNEPTVIKIENTENYGRLALPTLQNTSNKTKQNLILFSLMPEAITKGPSIILDYVKGKASLKFNIIINALITYILSIANTPEVHTNLSPEERDFLIKIKETDDKTLDAFKDIGKILKDLTATKSFVHLYLKKGIKLYDNRNVELAYMRGCVVTFPFYNELKNESDTIFGKKYRKKDKAIFKTIFEELFPNIEIENKYSKGSNCDIAPYLESLLKVILSLNDTLDTNIKVFNNTIKNVFSDDFYDETTNLTFKCEWEKDIGHFYDFEKEYKEIPIQKESISEATPIIATPQQNTTYQQPYNPYQQQNINTGPKIVSPEEMAKIISGQANNPNPFFGQQNNFINQNNGFNNFGSNQPRFGNPFQLNPLNIVPKF